MQRGSQLIQLLVPSRGRTAEAEGSFEAAVRVNPTSARAYFHLGNVQFALQQFAAAEASFNSALKVDSILSRHSVSVLQIWPRYCNVAVLV